MPRYFFHPRIGEDVVTDEDGTDLHDPDHAWAIAKATIQARLSDPQNQSRLIAAVFERRFAEAVVLPARMDGTVH